jgi:lipopolysaccharide biosynthesis protein
MVYTRHLAFKAVVGNIMEKSNSFSVLLNFDFNALTFLLGTISWGKFLIFKKFFANAVEHLSLNNLAKNICADIYHVIASLFLY